MNDKINAWILIIVFAFIGISCDNDESPYDVEIVTDTNSYTIGESDTILVTLTNNSDNSIYYICTCQIYLEELNGQKVSKSWMVHGFEECLASVPVDPGEEDHFTVGIGFLHNEGHLDDALFNNSVQYRLRLDLFEEKTFRTLLEGSNILSNTFTIIQ